MDVTGDGVITLEDIMQSYDVSLNPEVVAGKITAEEAFRTFLDAFDAGSPEKDGRVERDEFRDYYRLISAAIDSDDYFELMIRNAWHMSGGEGQAASTTCRRVLVTHEDGRQTVEEIVDDLGIAADDMDEMKRNLRRRGIRAKAIQAYGAAKSMNKAKAGRKGAFRGPAGGKAAVDTDRSVLRPAPFATSSAPPRPGSRGAGAAGSRGSSNGSSRGSGSGSSARDAFRRKSSSRRGHGNSKSDERKTDAVADKDPPMKPTPTPSQLRLIVDRVRRDVMERARGVSPEYQSTLMSRYDRMQYHITELDARIAEIMFGKAIARRMPNVNSAGSMSSSSSSSSSSRRRRRQQNQSLSCSDVGLVVRAFTAEGQSSLSDAALAVLWRGCNGGSPRLLTELIFRTPDHIANAETPKTHATTGAEMALMDSPELLDGNAGPQEVGWGPFDRGHFGERVIADRELTSWPKRMRYRYSKTPVQAPTGFDGAKLIQRSAQLPAGGDLELEWVYGSNGKCLNNTHATARGEIVYHKAAVVVVHDPVRGSQRHFTYHDDDITCLAVDPSGTVAASGQMGRNPRICVWDLVTFEVLAVVGGMKHGKTSGGHGKDDGFFERSVCAVEFCSVDAGYLMGVGDDDHHSLGVWKWRLDARELEGLQMHGLMSTGQPSPGKLIGEAATMNGEPPQIYDLVVPNRRAVARQEALGRGGKISTKMQKFVTVGNSHTKFWSVDLNASIASGKNPLTCRNARYSTAAKRGGGGRMPRKTFCAAFAPDGKTVLTGASDGCIYVWDSDKGECVQSFLHHPTATNPAAAAEAVRSGKGGGRSGGKAASGKSKSKLCPVQALCVVPSSSAGGGYGFQLLSGAVDGTVRRHRISVSSQGRQRFSIQSAAVGDAPLCDLMSVYRGHREAVKNSNMNQTDTIIAPKASERMLSFKTTGSGGRGEDKGRGDPSRGSPEEDDPKSGAKLSKKQKTAMARNASMSNLRARHAVTSFVRMGNGGGGSGANDAIYVATRRGDVWCLDARTRKVEHFVQSHFGPVYGACAHPTIPTRFATAGEDQMLVVWDGHLQLCSQYLPTAARSVAYSPDGKHLAVGCGNGAVLIYTFQKERPRSGVHASLAFYKVVQDCVEFIDDLKYSPNGKYLAVASHDNYVDVYSVKRDRGAVRGARRAHVSGDDHEDAYVHTSRCRGHTSYVTHVDWSLDSRVLQSNCGAYEIIYWDAATGRPILSSTDTVEADTQWKDWTCVLGFPVMGVWSEGTDGTDVNSCHMSSDARHLVTGDDFGKLKLFNAPCVVQHAPAKEYMGHSSHVMNVRWLLGDNHVVSVGGWDEGVMLWRFVKSGDDDGRGGGRRGRTTAWKPLTKFR
jgi:WD40 repeat protein